MEDIEKLRHLGELLERGSGTVHTADLLKKVGTPRRARRAVFVARKRGAKLDPVRQGRDVTSYVWMNQDITWDTVMNNGHVKRVKKAKNPVVVSPSSATATTPEEEATKYLASHDRFTAAELKLSVSSKFKDITPHELDRLSDRILKRAKKAGIILFKQEGKEKYWAKI